MPLPAARPVTTELIYFNAGGGHRAAARALEAVIHERYPEWDVRCVNLVEVLDPHARFERLAGMQPEDVYNRRLARGWTAGMVPELRILQAMIRLGHGFMVPRLRSHWQRSAPDMVVSLIPNFNLAMHAALRAARPRVPYVTVMTDMADYPPSFWIEPGTSQHVICGTERACTQALEQGIEAQRIHRVSGMILRPDFYEPRTVDVARERAELGLDPAQPTGVVMFGGHGSAAMVAIAKQLSDVQLILMCGHNAALAQRLRQMTPSAKHAVVEFTPEVSRYMQLADFFIGKPGPGSLTEAVQQGLPVITMRNAWTMPQERYNTEWVVEHGLGVVVRSNAQVRAAVQQVLANLEAFKASVGEVENRALFEVPEVLARILFESRQARLPTAADVTPEVRLAPRAGSFARVLRLVGKSLAKRGR